MKKIIIVLVMAAFLFTGYAYSQNCGACPSKSTCASAKKVKKSEIKVYILKAEEKSEKLFHKKDCLKKDAVLVSLTEVKKKGYKPCQKCFAKKTEKTKK